MEKIVALPLSQLSEAGMCKTSRRIEKQLGNILKRGESNSPNYFRSWICRDVIKNALKHNVKSERDIMEYMNGRYVEAGYINPQQKNQNLLDDWHKICRYIKSEQRVPSFEKEGYVSLKEGELPIKVSPTVLFPVGDSVEIVIIKIGRPNITRTGDKGRFSRDLQLYAMVKYARQLGYKNIRASFYFLTKTNDTSNWSTNEPLFFGSGGNVVSMTDFWNGEPNELDAEMQELIDTYYEGVDDCIAEEHNQKCLHHHICQYKKIK